MDVKMEEAGAGGGSAEEEASIEIEHKPEKTPYDLLKLSKVSAEDIVAKLLSMKKEGKFKSQNDFRELVTQMVLNFVSLRQANRNILVEEDRVKSETESAKAPVDSTTLQLHNLMYEKNHYLKAIKACKDFKSRYPDIELVPEEEFLKNAPDEIKGASLADDTAHNLMLKRLNFELHQRKELCKLRERLEQQKKSHLETIANRRKFLSSLPSHLKSVKKASLPVQQQLGVLHTKKQKQQHSAELLPPPLYVLYSQLMAQKEAFAESIDLEIIGSVKDAQAFARQQATRETGTSVIQDGSKMDDDIPDEDEDDQRRRKRPKKVLGKDNLDQTRMYQAHPLRVILHIYDEVSDSKPAKLVTLKFEYLVKLNVVCVGIEGSDEGPENSILCHLFPDDAGIELPHESAKLFLDSGKLFDEKRTMRPYKWAQHLSGIDFLPEISPLLTGGGTQSTISNKVAVVSGLSLYRQQNRVQTVIKRVRSRKKAQLSLMEQLDLFMNRKWPSLSGEDVPWALHTPLCSLHSWSPLGLLPDTTSNTQKAIAEKSQEMNGATLDGRSEGSKEDMGVIREDGELPSLIPTPIIVNDDKTIPSEEGADANHSEQLALMSKSVIYPVKALKSLSFKRLEEDMYLDSDSDLDESTKFAMETEDAANDSYCNNGKSWVDYGSREFCLILTRKVKAKNGDMKLEAKFSLFRLQVKITKEYPLRPPLFSLNLIYPTSGEASPEDAVSSWYNELRAMEAEVNLHILRMVPFDQQNEILSHQVRCLAMLFDFYMDEASQPLEKRKYSSIIDVGLAQPVSGTLLARSFRGRDRRRMISWKDKVCASGYPY